MVIYLIEPSCLIGHSLMLGWSGLPGIKEIKWFTSMQSVDRRGHGLVFVLNSDSCKRNQYRDLKEARNWSVFPESKIVIMGCSVNDPEYKKLMDLPLVNGIIFKENNLDESRIVLERVYRMHGGGVNRVLPGEHVSRMMLQLDEEVSFSKLSNQQKLIVSYIKKGMSGGDISKELGMKPSSARNQLSRIYLKLGVKDRMELMRVLNGIKS